MIFSKRNYFLPMRPLFQTCLIASIIVLNGFGMDRTSKSIPRRHLPVNRVAALTLVRKRMPHPLREIVYSFVGKAQYVPRDILHSGGYCTIAPQGIVHITNCQNDRVISTISEKRYHELQTRGDAFDEDMTNGIFLHKHPGLFAWPKNNAVEIWNWEKRTHSKSFAAGGILRLLELADGTLAVGHNPPGNKPYISLLNIDTEETRRLGEHSLFIKKIAIADERTFWSTGASSIKLWDTIDPKLTKERDIEGIIFDCAVLSTQKIALLAEKGDKKSKRLIVYDKRTDVIVVLREFLDDAYFIATLSGDRLAVLYGDGVIHILNSSNGSWLETLEHNSHILNAKQLIYDGPRNWLISCNEDETIVWKPTRLDTGNRMASQRTSWCPPLTSLLKFTINKIFAIKE